MKGNLDYEMSEYVIALQHAIEAHCRGRMADETDMGGCPWHAKTLNRYLARRVERLFENSTRDGMAVAAQQPNSAARAAGGHPLD